MDKTPFAGLTRLAPGESLALDGYSFQAENPRIIDRLLEVGAVSHRHDGHAALADPTTAPTLAAVIGGGALPASTTVWATYTLLDADGGETLPVAAQLVTTLPPLDAPTSGPTAVLDTSAGTLLTNTYLYALTFVDASGGETTIGAATMVTRPPGPANAQVQISGLTALLTASGAAGWRLWRSVGGGRFGFLAAGTGNTFTDSGATSPDCTMNPPTRNTTNATSHLEVVVPATGQPAGAVSFRVYLAQDGAFASPSVAGTYPVADFGTTKTYATLDLAVGAPPAVSRALPGASRIDAQTGLDNLFWKGPVADVASLPASGNTLGDVRITLDTFTSYVLSDTSTDPDTWTPLGGGGGGGSWKPPVATVGDLPLTDNEGDVRVVLYTGELWEFYGGTWNLVVDIYAAKADPHWKAPVGSASALPSSGNNAGDIRFALSERMLFHWVGSTWLPLREHEVWQAVVLENSWVDYGASTPSETAYYRDHNRVYLRGHLHHGSGADGNPIFTLPSAYRPYVDVYLAVPQMDWIGSAATTFCTIHVINSGEVVTDGYTTDRSVSLDGVHFALPTIL
jgi:hypothetical protein